MVSLFDLALDHLGGDLHRHTADLVLDLVDSLLALLRNVGLGLLLEGSGLCAGLAQQLFAAGGSRFLGGSTIWLASVRAFCRFCSYSAFMASASVRSFSASAIWLSALALRSAMTFLTGFSSSFLKITSWIIRLQIWPETSSHPA